MQTVTIQDCIYINELEEITIKIAKKKGTKNNL